MEECVFISQLGFISEHMSWLSFTEKEHFLPVFTEQRALYQHILRDVKSTKCELKEHLWERATWGWIPPSWASPLDIKRTTGFVWICVQGRDPISRLASPPVDQPLKRM